MNPGKLFLLVGIAFAALSVVLGAFGAHALKSTLEPQSLSTWQTGVQYQMFHALGLVALGLFASNQRHRLINKAGFCFIAGVVLFSGSLYMLSTTGIGVFGPITPIGGVLLIVGWVFFFLACWQSQV